MPIAAQPNFDPSIKWSHGAGCLHCGSNVSELGQKVGIQCVDLGVDDAFLGRFGLCWDCAVQVALAVGYVSPDDAAESYAQASEVLCAASEAEQVALSAAAQARLDKDTVERLLGSIYSADVQVSA
jgi:hypothetical protein